MGIPFFGRKRQSLRTGRLSGHRRAQDGSRLAQRPCQQLSLEAPEHGDMFSEVGPVRVKAEDVTGGKSRGPKTPVNGLPPSPSLSARRPGCAPGKTVRSIHFIDEDDGTPLAQGLFKSAANAM